MSNTSNTLSDAALIGLFEESGHNWIIRGGLTGILGMARNLQSALIQARQLAGDNNVVQAIVRQPSDNIVISPDQIGRLWKQFRFEHR